MKNLLNKNGQALVEFVIILPIILMVIFVIIDFSNIFYQKNHLEGITSDIVAFKESGKSDEYIKKRIDNSVTISYEDGNDTLKIITKKEVNLITPFSSMFFDNPYVIKTERTILYE